MLLTISVLQRLPCKQDITIGLGDIQNTVYNNTYFDSIEKKNTPLDFELKSQKGQFGGVVYVN